MIMSDTKKFFLFFFKLSDATDTSGNVIHSRASLIQKLSFQFFQTQKRVRGSRKDEKEKKRRKKKIKRCARK